MGRYFLHLEEVGGHIIKDREGLELLNLRAAQEEALEAARGLLADAIKSGADLDAEAVIVTDDQGHELDRVPLRVALPKNFQ
jgi:hypothetical protein